MDVVKLIDKVIANVKSAPNKNRLIGMINDTIMQINTLIEPFDMIITVAQNDDSVWETITTNWEDITTNWEDLGRFTDWFSYNSDDNRLTVDSNRIQRIREVYLGGIAQRVKTYEGILAGIYDGNEIAIVGKSIYFATDISVASSGVIKMKVSISFPSIKGTETSYSIPDFCENLIYNNLVYLISDDEDQKKLAKELYDNELQASGIKINIYGEK